MHFEGCEAVFALALTIAGPLYVAARTRPGMHVRRRALARCRAALRGTDLRAWLPAPRAFDPRAWAPVLAGVETRAFARIRARWTPVPVAAELEAPGVGLSLTRRRELVRAAGGKTLRWKRAEGV